MFMEILPRKYFYNNDFAPKLAYTNLNKRGDIRSVKKIIFTCLYQCLQDQFHGDKRQLK